uniref:Peptidase C1A papain C-terminal domain-containing protein n=1 Tax=Bubo bubo TaxID=30461 RepID=A0A8C0FVT3_BUBBB
MRNKFSQKEWSESGIGCPGRGWSPHPWVCLRAVWVRCWGMWGRGELCRVGLRVGLDDLKGLFQPEGFCDSDSVTPASVSLTLTLIPWCHPSLSPPIPLSPGAVTPVKDQAVCGSCWSFATTGAMEGALFLKTGVLTPLSQQVLIDCSWGFGNYACDGGEEWRAYEWIKKHGGIASTESYGTYKGQVRVAPCPCRGPPGLMLAKITGYVNVTSGNITAVKAAIYKHGPVAVSIDASHRTFSFYSNGIYYEPKCANKPGTLDHAVLAVGYGVLQGETYWLIKNSWSTYWGNDGYILMAMKDNNCGVATEATYPILA